MANPDHKQITQVFVAYSYRLYPATDYRLVFRSLENLFEIKFFFADEKITNNQILGKIEGLIRDTDFGIYDITGWNPNVTLELGLALGLDRHQDVYIAFNKDINPSDAQEVPADLRGKDRIQFSSLGEFRQKLHVLLRQRATMRGTILHNPDLVWSPLGQPIPTQLKYAAAFRDIAVQIVPDRSRPERMIVDLSLRVESRGWNSPTYDDAPWINIDFRDKDAKTIPIKGSMNYVVAEFKPNDNRFIFCQKELDSNRWQHVDAVNVWASRGYALSVSWIENFSPYMILAQLKRITHAFRRRLTTGKTTLPQLEDD